ncbi:MAG: CPBP family glutamic-type intramembrane protease [Haloferacaceae archaeon]
MSSASNWFPPRTSVPTEALFDDAEPLSDRLRLGVVAGFLPVVLTSMWVASYVGLVGPEAEVTRAVVDAGYGLAGIAVLGGVYLVLGERERRATIRFTAPGRTELLWTAICLPLAVGAFLLGSSVGELLGYELGGLEYSLSDPVTVAAVVFAGVVVAPVVEEILFRGLLLGSLLGRGTSPAVAGGATVLLFASMHLVSLGVAGVLAIAGWAVFPTLLRLRFNNLTGAWLLHVLNNVYSYLVVVALGLA